MATLSKELIAESSFMLVEQGAGRGEWVYEQIEKRMKAANIPGVKIAREDMKTGLFSESRNFLVIENTKLREHLLLINARDFGTDLDVSMFHLVIPSGFKRLISKQLQRGNPIALSMNLSVFSQQDLGALKMRTKECLRDVLEELAEELKQDTSAFSRKSSGLLSMW